MMSTLEVVRLTRNDGRLVTISNLTKLYKEGELIDYGKPYIHRIKEEDSNDRVIYTTYSGIGDLSVAKEGWSKIMDKLMWRNDKKCKNK